MTGTPAMTSDHYLWHVTLDTGDTRRSPRSEVGDDVVRQLQPHLRRAIETGNDPIPGTHNSVQASSQGLFLAATVMSYDGLPILTFAVAPRDRGAARIWSELHQGHSYPTEPAQPPAAPWCAVRLELPALVADINEWVGDYERCLAWAWIEMRSSK